MKAPGCPRCRLDLIEFLVEVKLPRFTMHVGEEWQLPQSCYTADGSAEIGHGIAPAGTFRIVERDHSRASHNGLACPGNPTIEQQGACDGSCGGAKLANGYCTRCAPNQPTGDVS